MERQGSPGAGLRLALWAVVAEGRLWLQEKRRVQRAGRRKTQM